MYSELVDTLRCLNPHEDSWLVAAADLTEGRHILRGMLGCPICHARYPISDGIADFTGGARRPVELEPERGDFGEDDALKLAAMLDLTTPAGYVLLVGRWARLAGRLRELAPVTVLAVNAPPDVVMGDGISGVLTGDRIPVAAGSARGAALDAARDVLVASAVAALRAGGRIVGEASIPDPDDVTIVARDDRHWVGTRRADGPLLQLVRSPG